MKIILDAMGTDDHPIPEIEAAAQASMEWPEEIVLVGQEDLLRSELEKRSYQDLEIEVVHAPEVLSMSDRPADTARGKARSSMAVGIQLVREGRGDAFVTLGNAGGVMANSLFILGRIRGVRRPALSYPFPTRESPVVVLDIGVNADAKPEYLVQFGQMGSVYAEKILGVDNPRVAILSNGEEAGKGNMLVKESYPLLEKAVPNFIGNVEAKEVYQGVADVVVTDGFTGNVFMKTSEAVATFLVDLLKNEILASRRTMIGGALVRPAFERVRPILDASEHGAGVLLGVNGVVLIGHGRYGSRGVYSSIRAARRAVENELLDAVRASIPSKVQLSADKRATL